MADPERTVILVFDNPPPEFADKEFKTGFAAEVSRELAEELHIPVVVTVYDRSDVESTTLYEPND